MVHKCLSISEKIKILAILVLCITHGLIIHKKNLKTLRIKIYLFLNSFKNLNLLFPSIKK